jgi:hypothetical protein
MAFDNSLGETAAPIGTFSEIVEGIPVTPGNYLDCLSGSKVKVTFSLISTQPLLVSYFNLTIYRMQPHTIIIQRKLS